jgi:hypothetical protein
MGDNLVNYTLFDCLRVLSRKYPHSSIDVDTLQLNCWLDRSFGFQSPEGWGYEALIEVLPFYGKNVLYVSSRIHYETTIDLSLGPRPIARICLGAYEAPVFYVMQ